MVSPMHRVALLMLLVGLIQAPPAFGQANGNPMAAIRAGHWNEATLIAAGLPDATAMKLVAYYRVSAPAGGTLRDVVSFVAANPDWPAPGLLERRRQEALAAEPDDSQVLDECSRAAVTLDQALVRCADVMRTMGRMEDAAGMARKAWITGFSSVSDETEFLARWGGMLIDTDEVGRFDTLVWTNPAAADLQIARLGPRSRPAAEAWRALHRDDPAAGAMVRALAPAPLDPGLMLEQARSLRRSGHDEAALTLWLADGQAAQAAMEKFPARLAGFWNERQRLARQLLHSGNAAGAYSLVAAPGTGSAEAMAEAGFLAGFIALRRLDRPDSAIGHFEALARASHGIITRGRAYYWLGRAQAAAGRDPGPAYQEAAALPTSFYGQLAAVALGEGPAGLALRINALRDPTWTDGQARAFEADELAHAAGLLVSWGEPGRAAAFVLRLDELAQEPGAQSLAAGLAARLGMPNVGIMIARRMGRDGIALAEAGWPAPVSPPAEAVNPSVTLGLIRQESSFDAAAVSDKGARGLMQLMPGTAEPVAKRLGLAFSQAALTADPGFNMQLGTAYLRTMLDRYGGFLPVAIAAYNAGPTRVDTWRAENGDPAGAEQINLLDWIELVPLAETRNYIQRVLENVVVYRARQGDDTPVLDARWNR